MVKNTKMKHNSVIAYLDYFIFVKNYYSVWKHLIPFSIAALLLLTLSIPKDNLLLKLVGLLQRPSMLWLPATLLTVISTIVYFYTINVQICQAYLWSNSQPIRLGSKSLQLDDDFRRTICTSLTYIILGTLMAYVVLWSVPSDETTSLETIFGDIWASYLLAILSLTGIGWSGPNSWVESIGIHSPNYTEGRRAAKEMTNILNRMRKKTYVSNKQDVEDFSKAIENLLTNIETNRELEPEWAKDKLVKVSNAFIILSKRVKDYFTKNNLSAEEFSVACRCEMEDSYKKFIEILNILSEYWCEWQCRDIRGSQDAL